MPILPSSLNLILSLLQPAFTAPTFEIFKALVAGFIGRVGDHTVTGIWQAARLAGRLHHSRAHDFFARARWSLDEVGLLLLDFLIERFVDQDDQISLAVDGTVFKRSGRKVYGTSWHHHSTDAPSGNGFRFGNCFVVVALVIRIPALGKRAWSLPILFRLWQPTPKPAKDNPYPEKRPSQQDLAQTLVSMVAKRYENRPMELVGDAAFACSAMAALPESVTVTTRLRANAVLSDFAPGPTGKRGRPRIKGERLGSPKELAEVASAAKWQRIYVHGRGEVMTLVIDCLWYSVFGSRPIRVVIVRKPGDVEGYDIALISTDLGASPAELVARYADRWSIEVAFQDAKHVVGVGQARNRVPEAVKRTVPFGFLCQTLTVAWYGLYGDPATDVYHRRLTAPWYRCKGDPSMLDMLVSLRREMIRSELMAQGGWQPKVQQKDQAAWLLGRGVG